MIPPPSDPSRPNFAAARVEKHPPGHRRQAPAKVTALTRYMRQLQDTADAPRTRSAPGARSGATLSVTSPQSRAHVRIGPAWLPILRNRGWRRTGHLSARNHARSSSAIMSLIVPNPRSGSPRPGHRRSGACTRGLETPGSHGALTDRPGSGRGMEIGGRAAFSCGGHDRTAETTSETGAPPGLLPLITERVRHVHTV